jgi:hypothetical protein
MIGGKEMAHIQLNSSKKIEPYPIFTFGGGPSSGDPKLSFKLLIIVNGKPMLNRVPEFWETPHVKPHVISTCPVKLVVTSFYCWFLGWFMKIGLSLHMFHRLPPSEK